MCAMVMQLNLVSAHVDALIFNSVLCSNLTRTVKLVWILRGPPRVDHNIIWRGSYKCNELLLGCFIIIVNLLFTLPILSFQWACGVMVINFTSCWLNPELIPARTISFSCSLFWCCVMNATIGIVTERSFWNYIKSTRTTHAMWGKWSSQLAPEETPKSWPQLAW